MFQQQLSHSFERIIVSGCDRRLIPRDGGLNLYGVSVAPRSTMALGSCSCSSPTPRASVAARAAWQVLQNSSNPSLAVAGMLSEVRETIRRRLLISNSVDIVLTPSGTDLEILALALVDGNEHREIVNIIVGSGEVGSGTANAAAGRHYDQLSPRGTQFAIGESVNASLASRVSVAHVPVRDARGEILSAIEVDDAVTQIVIDAASRDARILLHIVAHSKTGIHAPTLGLVDRLTRTISSEISVMVDAAQGRLASSAYQAALDRGYLVAVTGSKFFGGPPFAGALLVPESFQPDLQGIDQLPAGLHHYFGREDFPVSWKSIRHHCDGWVNFGSAIRWVAAASEIEAYYAISAEDRNRIAKSFSDTLQSVLAESTRIKLVRPFNSCDHFSYFDTVESVPTVFTVEVDGIDGQPLDESQLRGLHDRLNHSTDNQPSFHLGQPVAIGTHRCSLRIALGAPLITQVATDEQFGPNLSARIDRMERQLCELQQRMVEQTQQLAVGR